MNDYAHYVNPFVGTAGECRWSYFAPAALPFGMVKLAPVTYGYGGYAGGGHPTGYDYRHRFLYGFSHLRESQIGAFLTMPCAGTLRTTSGTPTAPGSGFGSRFDKADEKAEPGYYSVYLRDSGVRAELGATTRVGFHRYTFPKTDEAYVIFDIGHNLGESGIAGTPVHAAAVSIGSEREVEGSVVICPPYIGCPIPLYFFAEFSVPFVACGTFREADVYRGERSLKGPGIGAFFQFQAHETSIVEFKVAVSFVSVEQARRNMRAEAEGWTFDQARANALSTWNRALGRIEVEGNSEEDKVKFYTGLWHVLLGKGASSDADGVYVDASGRRAQIPLNQDGTPEYSHYNTDAFWGSWWSLNQVLALVYPEVMSGFTRSMLDVYDEGGWIPDGMVCDKPNPGMPLNHAGAFVACAYSHGIRNFDASKALDAVYRNITAFKDRPEKTANPAIEPYSRLGFVPVEVKTYGPSGHTLEYAFEDWCVSELAKALGRSRDAEFLRERAGNYRNLFDAETKFMRARKSDGSFVAPFDPMGTVGFAEGNEWQYTWFVPHDIAGLIRLMGRRTFNHRLHLALEMASYSGFSGIGNQGGYLKTYNQGNETDLHAPYLFNYAGKPWLTQYWVRRIMDEFYGTTADKGYGYGQDDDQGILSAWFVLSAMGIFDVRGGAECRPSYQIGSPLFGQVTIHLNEDFYPAKQIVIEAEGNSRTNRYVQAACFNGRPLSGPWFFLSELLGAGRLRLVMGAKRNTSWGNRVEDAPPSMSDGWDEGV